MARITVTTDDGTVVETISTDGMDLTRPLARNALSLDVFAAVDVAHNMEAANDSGDAGPNGFSGIVKGLVSLGQIADRLAAHGADRDAWNRIKLRRSEDRHGMETHFDIDGGDALEHAMHRWFQEPGEAPFPEGTLLHFRYRNDSPHGLTRTSQGAIEVD